MADRYTTSAARGGNDSNSGTILLPWATLAKNNSTLVARDVGHYDRGVKWREQGAPGASGAGLGAEVIWTSYGSGPKPAITACDLRTGWTTEAGSPTLYYTAQATLPQTVIQDGVLLKNVALKTDLVTSSFWWDSVNLRLYVFDDPTFRTLEVGVRNFAITTNNQKWLIFDDLDLQGTLVSSSYFISFSSTDCVISNCEIHNTYTGIQTASTAGSRHTIGPGNYIHHCHLNGMSLGSDGLLTGFKVLNNEIAFIGIDAWQMWGALVTAGCITWLADLVAEGNYIHDVTMAKEVTGGRVHAFYIQGPGAGVSTIRKNRITRIQALGIKFNTTTGSIADFNLIWNVGGSAIGVVGSTAALRHNTLWGCTGPGVSAFDDASANHSTILEMKNNIIGENAYLGGGYQVNVAVNSSIVTVGCDRNLYYQSFGGANLFAYQSGTTNKTWAQWQADGRDISSPLPADPLFVNALAEDFRLQRGSLAVNKGLVLPGVNDTPRYKWKAPDLGYWESPYIRVPYP